MLAAKFLVGKWNMKKERKKGKSFFSNKGVSAPRL